MLNHDKENSIDTSNLIDEKGIIQRWPKKKDQKLYVLFYLANKFDDELKYLEKDINDIICKWHDFNDFALLRREMIINGFLKRTPDCREYWKEKKNITTAST